MRMISRYASTAVLALLVACSGGSVPSGGGSAGSGTPAPAPTPAPAGGAYAIPASQALTVVDVQRIIAQAVGEAQAQNLPSIIAVVDRVGNVLAVFQMNGAQPNMVTSRLTATNVINNPNVDAQGLNLPASLGAIAKAVTGAFLSSGGNAFSTRTASQIVQANFPPAPTTVGLESGPLSGVQFSQLPCSDLNTRFKAAGADAFIGPKRSPLGLAADPGGLPLYKNGVLVGAIGVMGDGDYGFDPNVLDIDTDAEELIALAGIQGFAPPEAIIADKITVDGTSLRFSDAKAADLSPLQTSFAVVNGAAGALVAVGGFFGGAIVAGTAYGSEASGFRQATGADFAFSDAFVLSNGGGGNRFPIRAGTDGAAVTNPLTAAEVRAILEEAFKLARRSRGQIRKPVDSQAQVTISMVDTYGAVLGIVRSPDAPIFGTDVSLQKARTVGFFANAVAAQQLLDDPDPEVAQFVQRARTFFSDPAALTGKVAFGARAIGNISRPHFPDGEANQPPGPFSRPIEDFNAFATGLQVKLILENLKKLLGGVESAQCTNIPATPTGQRRLANGIQIFSGGVPIYRGNALVGAIGVSGDGIDQDDMISFLGAHNGGQRAGSVGNAPSAIRSDKVVINVGAGVRLRYVNCPFAPFLDTNEQNVCEGL